MRNLICLLILCLGTAAATGCQGSGLTSLQYVQLGATIVEGSVETITSVSVPTLTYQQITDQIKVLEPTNEALHRAAGLTSGYLTKLTAEKAKRPKP